MPLATTRTRTHPCDGEVTGTCAGCSCAPGASTCMARADTDLPFCWWAQRSHPRTVRSLQRTGQTMAVNTAITSMYGTTVEHRRAAELPHAARGRLIRC